VETAVLIDFAAMPSSIGFEPTQYWRITAGSQAHNPPLDAQNPALLK